jgi:hypothetical protein
MGLLARGLRPNEPTHGRPPIPLCQVQDAVPMVPNLVSLLDASRRLTPKSSEMTLLDRLHSQLLEWNDMQIFKG